MLIEIEDRLYKDFKLWAEANNMSEKDMVNYIVSAFRNQFNLDKYGDLNEKIKHIKNEEPVKKIDKKTVKKDDVAIQVEKKNVQEKTEEKKEKIVEQQDIVKVEEIKPNPKKRVKVIKSK